MGASAPLRSPPGGAVYNICGDQKTRENGDMQSLAWRIAQYSLNKTVRMSDLIREKYSFV